MSQIILKAIGWLGRKFGLLLLLIIALLLAPSVKDAWRVLEDFQPEAIIKDVVNQTQETASDKNSSVQVIKDRLAMKKAERVQLAQTQCILPTCTLVKDSSIYRTDVEIEVIAQLLSNVEAATRGEQDCQEHQQNQPIITSLRQSVLGLNRAKLWWMPTTPAHKAIITELEQLEARQTERLNSCLRYRAAASTFQVNQRAIKSTVDTQHAQFLTKLNEFKESKEQTLGQVQAVLPYAFLLLLGIILTPIGFKTFAYYALAPLATLMTRKFAIRLQPSASGELMVLSPNNFLQRIELNEAEEFLFSPALLLRSAPDNVHKSTKYLLDWSMPLTSIASGMCFLTRISPDTKGIVTVGCDNVSNGSGLKITVIDLPENSSLVLQPRCLAGIVQNINRPIRITRHWRLASFSSWLTLQLRYVAFHGPAKLVLKGNNGVEVDPSMAGTTLNQVATLGFTANLDYSVSRCGTFYSYYNGKDALLDDRFSGAGFYLHEVSPCNRPNGPWGIMTHPFEIIWEVLTKAIGI